MYRTQLLFLGINSSKVKPVLVSKSFKKTLAPIPGESFWSYRWLPWFWWCFADPWVAAEISYATVGPWPAHQWEFCTKCWASESQGYSEKWWAPFWPWWWSIGCLIGCSSKETVSHGEARCWWAACLFFQLYFMLTKVVFTCSQKSNMFTLWVSSGLTCQSGSTVCLGHCKCQRISTSSTWWVAVPKRPNCSRCSLTVVSTRLPEQSIAFLVHVGSLEKHTYFSNKSFMTKNFMMTNCDLLCPLLKVELKDS